MVGALLLLPPGVFDPNCIRFCSKTLIACALMAATVVALENHFVGFKVVLGALTFVISTLMLKIFTKMELRMAVHQVKAKIRRAM